MLTPTVFAPVDPPPPPRGWPAPVAAAAAQVRDALARAALADTPPAATAAALAAAAGALGRSARTARLQLDDLLTLVETVAADARGRRTPMTDLYARADGPERDAALLHLWRAARHAYQGAPPPTAA